MQVKTRSDLEQIFVTTGACRMSGAWSRSASTVVITEPCAEAEAEAVRWLVVSKSPLQRFPPPSRLPVSRPGVSMFIPSREYPGLPERAVFVVPRISLPAEQVRENAVMRWSRSVQSTCYGGVIELLLKYWSPPLDRSRVKYPNHFRSQVVYTTRLHAIKWITPL